MIGIVLERREMLETGGQHGGCGLQLRRREALGKSGNRRVLTLADSCKQFAALRRRGDEMRAAMGRIRPAFGKSGGAETIDPFLDVLARQEEKVAKIFLSRS